MPDINALERAMQTARTRLEQAEAADRANPYRDDRPCAGQYSREAGAAYRALLGAIMAYERAVQESEGPA